jgi:hypothetical protein
MRYYKIIITPPANATPGVSFTPITYTSVGALGDNYSALQVDLDIYQAAAHTPAPLGSITLYGVSFDNINQSIYLPGALIQVFVGMTAGLPFANPDQIGLIVEGTILQAFGNFQGNNVSLSLIITGGAVDPTESINLPLIWRKGDTLTKAVTEALQTGYIGSKVTGSFSQDLVAVQDETAIYTNLKTLAVWVNSASKAINSSAKYSGASIVNTSSGFQLYDSLSPQVGNTLINYVDLIGNITWLNVATISAKVVMRADLEVGKYVSFPALAPVVNTAIFNQYRNKLAFDGIFLITRLRHQGSSRQANADSWVTIIEAIVVDDSQYMTLEQ